MKCRNSSFDATSAWPGHNQTPKNWIWTQADKQSKVQACTKEEFLLFLKKQTRLFFKNDSQTHLIAAKALSTQY